MVNSFVETNTVYGEDENIKTIKKKPVWISRKIVLNISGESKNVNNYPKNKYSCSRYNYVQFVIISLLERFKRIPIIIGLISFIISFFLNIESRYRWSFFGPSLFFSVVPSFMFDLSVYVRKRIVDHRINNKNCFVFDSNKMQFVLTRWRNIKVGDVICVLDGEQFPADVVVLYSSGKMAYVSSEMVDGSRLKRSCEPTSVQIDFERAIKDIILIPGRITCDIPSDDIYHFEGSLKWEGKPRAISLNIDNFVQMFSKLTFANWVLAIVVYTGKDTRIACKQHSCESIHRYNPRIRIENILSLVFTIVFIVFNVIAFIHVFPNNVSIFEHYSSYMIGRYNNSASHLYKTNWYTMFEFIILFNMCVPITVVPVTDLIRIFEFIKLSCNKSILSDNGHCLNETNESRNNSLLSSSKYLNKINNSGIILNSSGHSSSNKNERDLEYCFHKYDSLDSFGEVDFSLISQDSITETEPMRLKFISLNSGQKYIFKNGLSANASPKFSVISGLVWRHHSISWHRSESSRFMNGHLRVVRPNCRSSLFNSEILHSKKLELFRYHSVISAISKLGFFKDKENSHTPLVTHKAALLDLNSMKNENDRNKVRKYYKKQLLQLKGFKNTYVDEPNDLNVFENRNTWPPLPLVRVKRKYMTNSKTKTHTISNKADSYHPALPIHLFPKRLTRMLNHVILSNKRVKMNKAKLNIDSVNNDAKGAMREHSMLDTNVKSASREDNEEILHLMFSNIFKLTSPFCDRKTNEKYELFDEYSSIIKNLLIESINYTLKSSFCTHNKHSSSSISSPSEGLNMGNNTEKNCYNELYCDSDSNNNNGSFLVDMLYAMAICNSSVPHLRIVETNYCNKAYTSSAYNNANEEYKTVNITNDTKGNTSRDGNSSRNYIENFGSNNENTTLSKFSKYSIKDSVLSLNDLSSSVHRKLIKTKTIKLSHIDKRINQQYIDSTTSTGIHRINIYKKLRKSFRSTRGLSLQGSSKLSVNNASKNSDLLMFRYNKEYEKLHDQRRKGNIVVSPREILLTKYFIKYIKGATSDEVRTVKGKKRTRDKYIFMNKYAMSEFRRISRRLKYSFKSNKKEKISRHYENYPKSYVQYSGIDENDLTIVNTAASFGMRLVLVNSQHIVVESFGRTVFASLIYRHEDPNKEEISLIVKFPQNRDSILYIRGVASNILPLIDPLSIRPSIEASVINNNVSSGSCLDSGNSIKNYDDLIYITKKLDYQGYKVYIYAKKVLTKSELDKMGLRRNLMEKNENFKFLLNLSAEDYYSSIKNHLEYLGHIGIEYRVQENVPKTIKSLIECEIKPWFMLNVSSTNSIRILHKIFPSHDKIPLIRMDRLPLVDRRNTITFLAKIYNELKIIVKNNYFMLEDINFNTESNLDNEDTSVNQQNDGNNVNNNDIQHKKNIFDLNNKYSDIKFVSDLITISTLNGEVQLSQLYSDTTDSNDLGGNVNINEWMSWFGNLPGHGIVNSLPGIVFSALQLNAIFQSRDLSNYFFSIATISPFVVISDSTTKDIDTITNYLRNNVIPKPVILGISGNTGNISALSSCDISVSVSNTDFYNESTNNVNVANSSDTNNNNNIIKINHKYKGSGRNSVINNNLNIKRERDSYFAIYLSNNSQLNFNFMNGGRRPGVQLSTSDHIYNDDSNNSRIIGKYRDSCCNDSIKAESKRKKKLINISVNNKQSGKCNIMLAPVTDVTINKFHQIIPLLTRVGRVTSYRTGMALYNNIFKIFYLMLPNLIFQFYCQWSGTLVYSIDLLTFCAVFLTLLPPIIYGFTGIDVPPGLLDLPFLYVFSKNGYYTSWITCVYYLVESIILSITSFYFGFLLVMSTSSFNNGISSDLLDLSGSQILYFIIGSLLSLIIKSKSFPHIYLLAILFVLIIIATILIITCKKALYSYIYGFCGGESYIFLLTIPLFISYLVILNVFWKIILFYVCPNPATSIRDWWLIHIKQYINYNKLPVKSRMHKSLTSCKCVDFCKGLIEYIKTLIWSEWVIIKNHININITDNNEYIDYLILQNTKIPTLTDSMTSKYKNYLLERIKRRKESLKRQNSQRYIQSNVIYSNMNTLVQPQINIIQPQSATSKLQENTYYTNVSSGDKVEFKYFDFEAKETEITPVDESVMHNIEISSLNTGFSDVNMNSNADSNLMTAPTCRGNCNYLSSNSSHLKRNRFTKPLKVNYFGDNRILVNTYNNFNDWRLCVYIHAITIWNPKQIYITNLVPTKKMHIKGMKSLEFIQSLTKYSKEEQCDYISLKKEYTNILNNNGIEHLLLKSNNACGYPNAITNNNNKDNITNLLSNKSLLSKKKHTSNSIIDSLVSVKSLSKNDRSTENYKKMQDSTLDLNINIINSSSSYGKMNTFSDDVKSLLNPYKLTFKVRQLELEYQRERQIETYQQRYAIRVVLFVMSCIFLKLGPYSINLSHTNYSWVGIMCVLFCVFVFINYCFTYISGKYSLNVRSQFPLLVLISVTSIVATTRGFTLVVIFPILSFIVFRLGFIKGLYVTIIGFICVIIGQFIWGIESSYLLKFLPILIGINSFCGFLGYRSELLYRAQFLLKTHTNDLRERQRQILDTMLPPFIVERLIKYKRNDKLNNKSIRISNSLYNKNLNFNNDLVKSINNYKNSVEDRGMVSVLFCDIYDFQNIVEVLQPAKLVTLLDKFFLILDCLIDKYNCTKIETVFETYLVASCLHHHDDNAEYEKGGRDGTNRGGMGREPFLDLVNLLRFGLKMHKVSSTIFFEIPLNNNNSNTDTYHDDNIVLSKSDLCLKQLKLKIGIHSGKVISGVVGKNKPQYALFGDTVNTASRMKSLCDSGKIQISSSTYDVIKDIKILKWRERRSFVKGKGIMDTYILERVVGSAYPDFTLIKKDMVRGKGVNSIQISNYVVKLYPDCDLLSEYCEGERNASLSSSLLVRNEIKKRDRNKRTDKENYQVIANEKILDLMDITLCFKDYNIEQKYLLSYYSDYTTLKTIEESLVIVVVTLVLQTLIYSILPSDRNNREDKYNFRILWTVRIVYISSILLSWLVLFSNYKNHQFGDNRFVNENREFYDDYSTQINRNNLIISNFNSKKKNKRNDSLEQMNYESTRHIGGPILFLNTVLAGGASMLMLTILWQFTMVNNSMALWFDEEIMELLLLATVHHNAGLLFRYIILFDLLILFLLTTIILTGIYMNMEGITVYVISLLINIIAAYLRERTGRTIYYSSLIAGNYEKKAQELLITMLPRKVLVDFQEDKLKSAYTHKNVTFIFSDICGFTQWAMSVEAENVVYMLSTLYAQFDESLSKFELFKLFTIGDAYIAMSEPELDVYDGIIRERANKDPDSSSNVLAAGEVDEGTSRNCDVANSFNDNESKKSNACTSGSMKKSLDTSYFNLTNDVRNIELIKKFKINNMQGYTPEEGARRSIAMAHDMLDKISIIRERFGIPDLNMRIGLHYGECIGGIVGGSRIRYEVWGHDIIIGNKMESCGTPGNITISGQLFDVLYKNFNHLFKFDYIGNVVIKDQSIDMYRTRMRRNIQLKINNFSNSENVSNMIKKNILRCNLKSY